MQSVTLLRLLMLGTFYFAGSLGCGAGDSAILATIGAAPSRTTQVVVSSLLDTKAAMNMQVLTPPTDTFAVELPSTTTGHLVLNATALDSDNCTQASSTAALDLPAGRIDVAMPLVVQSPRKCGSLAPCAASTVCTTAKLQPQTIQSVWVISPADIWAVGLAATLIHFDGTSWKVVPAPLGVTENLFGVWASATNNVWAVGAGGRILHYDGTTWSTSNNPAFLTLYGIWGVSSANIWAVGDALTATSQGTFLHFDGSSWQSITDMGLGMGRFNAVWADSPSFIYACGVGGLLSRFNGVTWNLITSGTTVNLHSIWGTSGGVSSSIVFATGDLGTILRIRYDIGSGWAPLATTGTTSALYGIFAGTNQAIYAVGSGGAVVRADSSPYDSFVAQSNPTLSTLFGVHASSNGIIWVGGSSGFLGYLDLRP